MSDNTNTGSLDFIEVMTEAGDALKFRQLTARNGNTYWATTAVKADGTRYFNKYGVNVSSKVLGNLPKTISVNGVTVPLVLDVTEKQQRRVRGSGKVTIEGHGEKVLTFRATETGPGTYNVSGSIRGASSGGRTVVDEL